MAASPKNNGQLELEIPALPKLSHHRDDGPCSIFLEAKAPSPPAFPAHAASAGKPNSSISDQTRPDPRGPSSIKI